jgi:hypothetical protein
MYARKRVIPCDLRGHKAWLLHEQDGLSFQQIGRQLFEDENADNEDPDSDPNN